MSNVITLYINSKDRTIITQPSTNFIYNLFPIGISSAKSYFVKSACIPLSNYVTIYPPTSGTNQTFVISDFTGNHTVTIASGNYTAQQLATTLQTQIAASGPVATYTVTYNTNTNLFTINATSSADLDFTNNNAMYPYQSIGSVIGFRDASHNPIAINSETNVAPFEASLSGPLCYYIKSNTLTVMTNSFFNGRKNSVIASIPNNQGPFAALTYLNPAPIYEPLNNIRFNQLDLQLVDEYNNEVILNDDWVVTISIKCDE